MTGFAPVLNGEVRGLDSSPDGTRLYAVGTFTTVNGVAKNRIVAFDTATGTIVTSFAAAANASLYAVTANATTVFFAGNLTSSNGVARPGHAAAALATTGVTTGWAPDLEGGRAYGMEVSPDGSKVVFGGSFTTLNGSGNPGFGLGAVNTTTGASVPWATNSVVRNAGTKAAIYGLSSDADSVYASAYNFGGTGNTEGTARSSWDGTLIWLADCRGDNYSASSSGGVVYITGHSHQCQWVGGFPQNNPTWLNQRAIAYSKSPYGVVRADVQKGQPTSKQLDWFPTINAGSFTGQNQGAWTVQSNTEYVVYAGEFTAVNGAGQQGLSRFAVPGVAPNKRGPELSGASWPFSTASYSASTVRISWPSNIDQDNELLTYRVYRDGVVVHTTTGLSRFWQQPSIDWVDSGLTAGSTHAYRLTATDPFGNVASTTTVNQVVATSGTYSAYSQSVTDHSPTFYYRLGETSGTAVRNLSGPVGNTTQSLGVINSVDGTAGSGVTRNVAGAIAGDPNPASQFNGTSNGRIVTSQQVYSDDSTSVETWFKTTSASGKLIGFGDSGSVTGNSTTYDQSLYLTGGKVAWSVYDSAMRTISSPVSYNDGNWHQAVGTLGTDGTRLYVDGTLVASGSTTYARGFWGYWKIGGDSVPSGSQNFSGTLDEVAIYRTTLSPASIAQHYSLRSGGVVNVPPTATFSLASSAQTVSVDGRGSTDPDGTISAFAWTWGDGASSVGSTSSHDYAAAGTYTVTLTVTDNAGATGTTTRTVAVAPVPPPPPPPPPGVIAQDDFTRTVAGGWGSAPTGGVWTVSSAADSSVNGTSGQLIVGLGTTRRAVLNSVSSSSTNAIADISIDRIATGGGTYAGVVVRQVGAAYYQARARFQPDGSVILQIMKGSTVLGNLTMPGLTYSAGSQFTVRIVATGTAPTSLGAKLWPAGSTEPAAMTLTASDSTIGLQAAGYVGVETYLSAAATNAPVTVTFDNFSVVTAQ